MARPTPPVERALRETVARLRAAGHEVVDWSSEDQLEGAELLGRMFVADGGRTIRKEIERSGEPWRPEMRQYEAARELSTCTCAGYICRPCTQRLCRSSTCAFICCSSSSSSPPRCCFYLLLCQP